jgi:hypothetical protein
MEQVRVLVCIATYSAFEVSNLLDRLNDELNELQFQEIGFTVDMPCDEYEPYIEYYRDVTDKEMAERKNRERNAAALIRDRELAEYKRLQEKFGDV